MSIYTDTLTLPGSLPEGVNPQPQFGAVSHHLACKNDGTLLPQELERLGDYCGRRMLPYCRQDRYARSDLPVTVKTVVLENDHLKAVFLPEFGARLYSLYSKDEERELLFCNPALRPANLAIRDAWLAGGIEWNLGHYGHTVFTSDPLHCTRVTADDGEEFLRFYEYEAMKAQVYQMDFHLPCDARQLAVHLRIENGREADSPLYWWTNIAVPLAATTRVFSGTPELVFLRKESHVTKQIAFGHGQMPDLPDTEAVDISYPARIPYSNEYFFQNRKSDPAPWESASGRDGKGFFERSTQPLFARKVFCWGNGVGGQHWQDYLSQPGQGNYIEIQAGLAPTQLHTAVLPAGGVISFTQLFGAFTAPAQAQTDPWEAAMPLVAEAVEQQLPAARVALLNAEYAAKSTVAGGALLHRGSARGALELARRQAAQERPLAAHLTFPAPEADSDYAPWLALPTGGILPEGSRPLGYVTDPAWLPYLQASMARPGGNNPTSRFMLGVMLAENGQGEAAKQLFQQDCDGGMAPWAVHAHGMLELRDGHTAEAAALLTRACAPEQGQLDASFREDAMEVLLKLGQYRQVWEIYQATDPASRTECQQLAATEAAVKLEEWDFLAEAFDRDYATIREGAAGLSEVWLEYQARLEAKVQGIPFTESQIDHSRPLPYRLNFRVLEEV